MLAGLLTVAPGGPAMAQSQPVTFTKSFATNPIEAGAGQTMTFTITSTSADQIFEIEFTDDLANFLGGITPTGIDLPANGFCGFGSHASAPDSTGILEVQGAFLEANGSCEFSVGFIVPTGLTPGDYTNTTSELNAATGVESFPVNAPAATATMTVTAAVVAPLIVSMGFSPDTIAQGGVSRLSYDLRNAAAVEATSISLSDTLPADVTVAGVPDASTTCGGTVTAAAGGDTLAFTGGAVAAGGACAISVDVTSAVAGSYSNGPEAVTSSLGASTPVQATLMVDAADAPVFTKAFSPDTIAPGGISRLTFTIDNGANLIDVGSLAFTDAFPSGLVVAGTPNGSTTCGGTFAPGASDVSLSFAGGAVAAGDACAISVDVTSAVAGSYPNTSGALTSDLPDDAPPALATLTVDEAPLVVSMEFSPSTIAQGGVSRLSYDLRNGAAVGATSISLSDTLPADVTVAGVPDASTTCGGTVTAAAGGNQISYSGGAVAAGVSCTISVDVTSAVAGSYSNGPEAVTSSLGASTPVQATLTVDAADALVFSKAFSPSTIAPGGISRLTFTIDNGANLIDVGSLAFTDAFPAGLVVAGTPNGSTTCGGTFAPGASDVSLAFAGGAVAAGDACAISVDVTSAVAGSYPNTSGALTSDLPDDAPPALATLTVDEAPLVVSMEFSPSTIAQGGVSRLSYDLRNAAAVEATSISLSDTLPADVTVAGVPDASTTCGGTVTAAAGGNQISYSGGAVAAGDACAISVDVTSAVAGSYLNGPEAVTSSLGASTPVQATLTVDAADALVFSKAFSPSTIAPGGISRLTFTIDNGANLIDVGSLAFTDAFPAGLVVAGTPNGSTTCGGTFAPGASDVSLAFAGGAVAAGDACAISVDVTSAVAGSYPNTSGALTSDLPDDAPPALATLTVDEAPLVVSMEFSPSTIAQGGVSRLSYDLRNAAAVEATSISLSDTLPADVTVADAATTCAGGVLTAPAGGDTIAFADGELAAGVSCTISVDVTSAVAGSYLNGPEAVTSSLGASTPVQATLTVDAADAPVFTKAFSPDTIAPGGISRLTFTIDNGANLIDVGSLAFTDAFPAGLVVAGTPNGSTTCGGTFAPGASDVSLSFAGGAVAAGDACAISVDVTSAVAGSYPNTSGALTSDLPDDAPPALATLTVDEAPLVVSMEFSPSTIAQGGVSRLSYDLRNGAAVGATSISLSDTLPADVTVAGVPDASTTCGGTVTAGGDTVAFADGELAAGVSCTISVDVTSAVAGSYLNGPESVTSSLGASTPVQATLTVDAADALVFSKAFSPSTIAPGGISRLTFTIDNGANLIDVGSLAFTDAFPAGLVVAGTPNGSTTCGGTFAPGASDVSLAFAGGAVAAGDACAISVDVTSAVAGSYPNTSGALTSDLPDDAPPALATLTVDEAPLVVSMEFSPSTIAQGGVSRLSYELNNDAAVGATSISLSDTLPADVVVADAPNAATTCAGGVLTAPAGGDTIAFADGELAAGVSCTISVDVTSAVAGSYLNGPEAVTSSLGASTPVQATLTVDAADAPVFTKAFSPDTIAPGGISRLTFTIDNGANLIDVGSLAFNDNFPDGMIVAPDPDTQTTCTGGTISAAAGGASVGYSGGGVAAGDACAISVDVTSAVAGSYPNTSGALTSDLPDAAPAATATLTVDEAPLIVLMGFSPSTIAQGGVSRLSYGLRNGAAVEATSISLSDTLPADVAVADAPNASTTCAGGVLTAPAGGDTIAFADGALGAGATCTLIVDVTSAVAGSYLNGPEAVTSSLGASTPVQATLTVDAADAPVFTKAFSPDTIAPGGISRLTFTIDNGANLIDVGSLAFTDAFPAGLVVAGTPNGSTTCGGTFAPGASDVSLAFAGGAVAAGDACAISVDVTSAVAGSYPNATEELTSALGVSTPALATLTVDEAPLIVSMEFSPSTIAQGGVSRLSYGLRNDAAVGATSISLSDTLPADVVVAGVPDASTTCGGTVAAGGDTVAFADGELAAGVSCTISVDVTSAVAGSYPNGPESVTSSLGDSTPVQATLMVDAADAPVFTKAFSPDTIAPGGISRLTFTIDNGANLIDVGSLAFTDAFPSGLVVAGTPNGSTTCGGTFAPGASDVSLAFAGGAVAVGASCTISVDVTSAVAGSYPNTSGALTSDLPDDAPPALATLTVNEAPLVVSMEFSPSTIAQGGVSRLSYDLRNGAAVGATSISLSDTLPADVVVAGVPDASTTCGGGTVTAAAGGNQISYSGGAVAAGVSCTISVDVTSAVAGSYSNGPESVTSSLGASTPVQATLTVDAADALVFSKAFSPDTIAPGGISRLTFTIDNGANLIDVGSLAFTDAFPAGLVVAGTPNGSTTCGGTFAPGASDVSLAFAGGAVAAGDACAISVDVTSAVAGSYPNTSGALTSDLPDAAPPALATLTVDEAPLIVSMGFSPLTIAQGGVSRLSYGLRNDAAVGATSISLSDTLPADVAVADAPNAATTCAGGVLTAPAGGDTIAFADGELAAGDACAISVDVTSAVAGSYSNGPETVTSSLGASTPAATATLTVDAADALVFTKAFSPDTIAPGGISRLTFTIDNGANLIDVGSLAFTDAFPSGLVVAGAPNGSTTCGGTFAPGASDVSLAFAGGAVAAGDACAISVDVTSAVAGSYPNTSGALTSDLPDAAPPALATLTVDEAPLIVSMGFSPLTIAQGGVSRLSYGLRNDAAVGATSISLSDTLPADVTVADAPNAATTCAGGVLTAPAGGDTLAFTGGAVAAAGGACAISVDVTSAVAGSYLNGPEAVTSSLGASTPVQATLTVTAADAPVFSKEFSPDTIAPGGISRLTFTIDNGANGIEAANLAFTDAFPAGLVVADTPDVDNDCGGGTLTAAAGGDTLAFAGGAVAAGDACAISVDVTSAVAGSYPNTSGALTSDLPDAAPAATATLTVNEAPLIVSMEFSPSTIAQGGVSRLSYGLRNGAAVGATSISLSDTLPADVVVADAPNAATTCAGGVLTAPAGGDTIAFADGELAAGDACAISVDVTSAVAGSYSNGPETVTSSLGASTPAATATLTVDAADALVFTKAFSPSTIDPGGISRLTFTIDNGANLIDVGSLAFTDAFPSGLVVAGAPNGSTTCGGTFAPGASDVSLAFAGGAVAAGDACAISVDVTSAVAGSYPNTSGALTSDLPDAAPPALATLTVDEAPLIVSMGFSPLTIAQGGVSRLSYGLRNDAAVGATSISLSDTLPADVAVAGVPDARTTCAGGVLTAPAGGDTIAFADGELAAGDACAISVDVTSAVAGSYSNGPESVTSSLGASTPAATATLTVDAADALVFTKAFSPSTIDPGGISRLTFTIDNGANLIDVGSLAFTDAFPAGLVVAGTPNGSTTCGGTFAPGASDVSLAFAGGAVAAGDACAISVDVTSAVAGSYPNTSGALTSDLPDAAPPALATLTVDEAPLIVSMGFSPSTIAQGGVSRLSYELNNDAAVGATSISLSDTLPADVVVADAPNAATTCGGGVLTAPAGGDTLAFTGGAVAAAGGACAISVDVTSAVAGSYSNGPEAVTSSLGASTPVQATLTVTAADAPVFSKEFSPDTIAPGGISRLTFTIDNGANGIEAANLAFTDAFPAGLVVADTPDVDNDCGGGTLTAAAGGDTLAFAGGAVAAGDACAISVDVTSAVAGSYPNTSGALTSDLPDAAPAATATLTVNEAPLIVSMEFSPSTIAQGGVSRLSYGLRNGAAVGATSISLSDTLPADVVVADAPNAATTCAGGVLTAPAGGDTIAFADGELAAGGACAISVDVTSAVAGSYLNGPESVTSSLGASTPVSATLTVTAAVVPAFAGTVTFDVTSDTDGAFGFSSAEPGLTTSLEISGGTGSTGALPVATAGSHSVTVTAPAGVRLTAIACDDTDSTADMSAATVSVTVDASEDVTCTITARSPVEETVETINRFLTRRADLILSSEPDPSRRFDRLKRGSGNTGPISFSNDDLKALLPFTAQGGNGDYGFSTSLPQARRAIASAALALGPDPDGEVAYIENHRFDAWFEAQYKEFDAGADRRGDFGVAYAGVDYLLTPDVLVGALVSFDTMEETTDTGTVSGDGWMAGPYMTARLAPALYFDGRLAAGKSDNRISPFGVYTDEFPTGRWLSMASLTGEFQRGDWTIRPHASLSYLEERQKSYVDGVGATIPGRTVRLGQFKIGPAFTGRFEGAEGRIYSPYLKVDAIYNVGDTTGATPAEANDAEVEGWRARVKAGVSMTTEHGTRLSLGATHAGFGRSDFETWGLTFELSVPIGKPKAR